MKEFINDNFYQILIIAMIIFICFVSLTMINRLDDYCSKQQNKDHWQCITEKDLWREE